jgi:hypothetical protein
MRRTAMLVLASAAFLSGCAPMQWTKADASAEQLRADDQQCRSMAYREANYRAWAYNPMTPIFVRDAAGRGAILWNNGAVVDPFAWQMLEENRLQQFCMEAKGYTLVPSKEAKKE